jgi:hypothetical protein
MMEILQPGKVPRCQATADHPDIPITLQCVDTDEHFGFHSAVLSGGQLYLWPSEDQIAEERDDAAFAQLTHEQVMFDLTKGDPEETKRVNEWAKGTARFTQAALKMRQQIDELTRERDEARELLAIGGDEERIKDYAFKVHEALTANIHTLVEDLDHVRGVLGRTRQILVDGGTFGHENLEEAAKRYVTTLAQPHIVWAQGQHSVGIDIVAENEKLLVLRETKDGLMMTALQISEEHIATEHRLRVALKTACELGTKLAGLECDSEAEDRFAELAKVAT